MWTKQLPQVPAKLKQTEGRKQGTKHGRVAAVQYASETCRGFCPIVNNDLVIFLRVNVHRSGQGINMWSLFHPTLGSFSSSKSAPTNIYVYIYK